MKTTLIFLTVVLMYVTCSSQSKITYGMKAGYVNAAQVWRGYAPYPKDFNFAHRSGIDVGAFIELPMTSMFSISPEIHYLQKGIREILMPTEVGPWLPDEIHTEYLSVPLLAKARFSESAFIPYVIAGPRVGVRVHTNEVGSNNPQYGLKDIDYGVTLGVGMDLTSIVPFISGIEFRYSPSFNDAYNFSFDNGYVSENGQMRNNSMEILLVVIM